MKTLQGTSHEVGEQHSAVEDAIAVIDRALGTMMCRELVSSGEVADLLLDVRTILHPTPPTE
jgi:hypothetical protein